MAASKKNNKKSYIIFVLSLIFTFIVSLLYSYIAGHSVNESVASEIYTAVHEPEEKVIRSHYNQIPKAQRQAMLEQIVVDNKDLKGIFYIKDGKYIYSDRDVSIKKDIVADLSNKVDEYKNKAVYYYIDKKDIYGSPAFIYMFKFGSGFYQMIFYQEAITPPSSIFSSYVVSNIDNTILSGNNKDTFTIAEDTLHGLSLSVITGISLSHFLDIYLIAFLPVLMIILLIPSVIEKVQVRQDNILIDINAGIRNKEFIPFYQGVYSVEQNRFVGVELLCRWNYKKQKILSPASFINILEDSGQINTVTLELLNQLAIDQELLDTINSDMYFSVNVTVNMLLDDYFVESVIHFLTQNPRLKNRITFELTERDKRFDYIADVKEAMCLLHSHSVKWALDDFGTGYSNFLTMHKLPIDIIKVDRMFISSKNDIISFDILTKIIDLLDTWKLPIIMEGVETEEELNKVKNLSIDLIQGYYFSKPLSVDDFIKYARS
ncbi:EAL domain-containing protein [Photobacterium angustum]|uniref:EAL domain-containing protein n=1 Tax=Photobacterium angustum TaxID=661 RepID=UPI0005E03F93|nr:EAL domain-containing protein [Photobacterium angustum]KJG03188.1 diguanylate phosphodiesterase [Photobacterium angustum]PSV66215.1 EAL domain-containing protein [Photobacterium angustum]